MTSAQDVDPIAQFLVQAYLSTASHSRAFHDEWGEPPTVMAKVHHLLAITQALINQDERYDLGDPYAEFGRVEFLDRERERSYVLRSESAVAIESAKKQQSVLFDPVTYITSDKVLLVHRFHPAGLDLSVAGTRRAAGKFRLEPTGAPAHLGTWPYGTFDPNPPFDQEERDAWDELGALDEPQEGTG
jgi:hypothetical protein